jgi:hypothetical protein
MPDDENGDNSCAERTVAKAANVFTRPGEKFESRKLGLKKARRNCKI